MLSTTAIAITTLRMALSYATQAETLFDRLVRRDSFEDQNEFRNLELDEIPHEIIIDVAIVMNQHIPLPDDLSPRDFGVCRPCRIGNVARRFADQFRGSFHSAPQYCIGVVIRLRTSLREGEHFACEREHVSEV